MSGQAAEPLTLSRGGSPASLFPWLESKKEKKTTVTYGRKCSELSENLRLLGLSVRTYLESCELPGAQFARTWSVRDTLSPFLILKLRLSERRIGGNECSLWQTPNVPNGGRVNPPDMTPTGMMPDGRKRQVGLEHQVRMTEQGLWPTPTARDYKDGSAESCKNVPVNGLLGRAVHLWATPNARDGRGPTGFTNQPSLPNQVRMFPTPRAQSATGPSQTATRQGAPDLQTVAGGQLNPTWVEWLMGFPLGWTDLNASETP